MEQGKIILSDAQIERFTKELNIFINGTQTTLYMQFSKKFPETDRLFNKFLAEISVDEEFKYHLTDFLLYRLTKDLFLYNDAELEELISHATFDLIKAHGNILTFFLAWLKLNYKTRSIKRIMY